MDSWRQTPSGKFVLVVQRTHGNSRIEHISRVVYDQDAGTLTIWIRDGVGEEKHLDLSGYDPVELHNNLQGSGADFVRSVAEILFRHAGYPMHEDIQAGFDRHVITWCRKERG